MALRNHLWVQDNDLCLQLAGDLKMKFTGNSLAGVGEAGHLWVEDEYLRYLRAFLGTRRSIEGLLLPTLKVSPAYADLYYRSEEMVDPVDADWLYGQARNAASADGTKAHGSSILWGQASYSSLLDLGMRVDRALMWFDTSPLPDDAILASAQLRLRWEKYEPTLDPYVTYNHDWYVKIRAGSDLNSLTPEDLSNFSTLLTAGTQIATKYAGDISSDMEYYYLDIPLSYINKTGYTAFSLIHGKDEANQRPDYTPPDPPIYHSENLILNWYSTEPRSYKSRLIVRYYDVAGLSGHLWREMVAPDNALQWLDKDGFNRYKVGELS